MKENIAVKEDTYIFRPMLFHNKDSLVYFSAFLSTFFANCKNLCQTFDILQFQRTRKLKEFRNTRRINVEKNQVCPNMMKYGRTHFRSRNNWVCNFWSWTIEYNVQLSITYNWPHGQLVLCHHGKMKIIICINLKL